MTMRKLGIGLCLGAFLTTLCWAAQPGESGKKSSKRKNSAAAEKEDAIPEGPLPNGIRFGNPITQRYKVGLVITAPLGPCAGIFGTIPVPTNWPEQQVKILAEDVSPSVKDLEYRTLENGVKQMLVTIPNLNPGEKAQALVTFEVTKSAILPPEDTSLFQIPEKTSRELARFLATSPYIESSHPRIKSLAKELVAGKDSAWEKVETIYDHVREKVKYQDGPLKGALAALKDGTGDCEELTSLFVALCRANRIPARTVWVPGHCYPEFYLEDPEGRGHWIPCQAAGTRDFGSMPDTRSILQKGDNFRVPEKKEMQRYVAEHLSVKSVRGTGKPQVQFVREVLPGK